MLSSTSSISTPPALLWQLQAGCFTIAGCSLLGDTLQDLSATAAFKIAAACSLVFGTGAAWFDRVLEHAQAGAEVSLEPLVSASTDQLRAVAAAVAGKLLARQPKAAAAFANSTGKPAMLLPWLRAVSRAAMFATAGTGARSSK